MWYAIVARDICRVTQDWATVASIAISHPYAIYRKFQTEKMAWDFVETKYRRVDDPTSYISNFGNCNRAFSLDTKFYIDSSIIYADVVPGSKVNTRLVDPGKGVSIQYEGGHIYIADTRYDVSWNSLYDRAIAIADILRLVGELANVILHVPDMSTFYTIMLKDTQVLSYRRLQELIAKRMGKVALTVDRPQYIPVTFRG